MKNYSRKPDHGMATQAVRSGQVRGPEGEHSDPVYLTSSFVFDSAAQAAARFSETEPGNIYSRFTNPSVRTFEERMRALEDGQHCTATASGMAAILTLSLALLNQGDHVVISRSVFGSTINLFKTVFSRFGITADYVDLKDYTAWEENMRPHTRLFLVEAPSNPLLETTDIGRLSRIASKHGVLLVVDNTFLTPVFQRPLELGADIVIHSATKYLDGQGRSLGGAIVVNDDSIADALYKVMRSSGATLSPFNAWVLFTALETLDIRMRQHNANASRIAAWLESQPMISRVYYPGLASHPDHKLAVQQQSGYGGVVSFEIHGGREDAWRLIDNTEWISITANLGDSKTTITHPASTTHCRITQHERDRAGISDSLIRLSIGLEDVADIKRDITSGLQAAFAKPTAP